MDGDIHQFYRQGMQALQLSNAELHKVVGDYAGEMRTGFARLEERLAGTMHGLSERARKHSENHTRLEQRVADVDDRAEVRDTAILEQLRDMQREQREISAQLHTVQAEQARIAGMWRGVALTASAVGALLGGGLPLVLHLLGLVRLGG